MKILAAFAILATSTPAVAQERAHTPQQVSDALKAGCAVQQTHQQAGKIGSAPAIIRCAVDQQAQASARPVGTALSDRR